MPRRRGAFLLLLAAIAAAAFAAGMFAIEAVHAGARQAPPPEPDGPFVLGVVRADGILLPFASYDDGDWKTPWPSDVANRAMPVALSDIPRGWWGGAPPSGWRLWAPDAAGAAALNVTVPVMFAAGRFRRLGLKTDRAPSPAALAPFLMPYPKAGLAVSGDVPVRPISRVSVLGGAFARILPSIRGELLDAEDRTIAGVRSATGWRHPFDRRTRAALEPELESWYTSALHDSKRHASYLEIVKKYPPGPEDDGCGLQTVISGWMHDAEPGDEPKTAFRAVVTYCDRDRASFMMPFGQIAVRNRTHWIYQLAGPDHEWYLVTELTPGRTRHVAEYHGGGFPR
jgi:hypothetical protein